MAFHDFGGNDYDPLFRHLLSMEEACKRKVVDKDITDGIDKALCLFQDRHLYCEKISSAPSEALLNLAEGTRSQPFTEARASGETKWMLNPRMLTGALEGQFLKSLVSMTNAKRVLDIGMYTGHSALVCAEALPADGKVVTCDFNPHMESIARDFFEKSEHGNKIQIRIGAAKDILLDLAKHNEQFDVIFIDANKDGYIEYYQIIMERNILAPRGTILFDNSLSNGMPYLSEEERKQHPHAVSGIAIKECMEYLQKDETIHKLLLPLRDGVCIVRRRQDVEGTVKK